MMKMKKIIVIGIISLLLLRGVAASAEVIQDLQVVADFPDTMTAGSTYVAHYTFRNRRNTPIRVNLSVSHPLLNESGKWFVNVTLDGNMVNCTEVSAGIFSTDEHCIETGEHDLRISVSSLPGILPPTYRIIIALWTPNVSIYPPVGGRTVRTLAPTPTPIPPIPLIVPEKPVSVEVQKADITNVTIEVKNEVSNVSISVQGLAARPPEIKVNPSGVVYEYFEINAENITDQDVESVLIEFKVEKSWITENDIHKTSVTLCRAVPMQIPTPTPPMSSPYTPQFSLQWGALPTHVVKEDTVYVYYLAESPGLSTYAITAETLTGTPTPPASTTPTPTATPTLIMTPTPGFEAVFAIVGLLVVYFVWKKSRR